MGMSAFGEPLYDLEPLLLMNNHRGVGNVWKDARPEDLAASRHNLLYERKLLELVDMCPKKNIILMGGCALNCVANSKILRKEYLDYAVLEQIRVLRGAAALVQKKGQWDGPYLGASALTVQYGFVVLFKNF